MNNNILERLVNRQKPLLLTGLFVFSLLLISYRLVCWGLGWAKSISMFGGLPRGDARCLVCNACNRLALLDSAGVDVLTQYILEYRPGSLERSSGTASKDVVGLAKRRNRLYLHMLGYLSESNSRLYEVKVLIRAIDAILNKQELPPMRDLSKLVRSYSPKYDPYGYWDTVGGYDPVESVTRMLKQVMSIADTTKADAKKYAKSPFYDTVTVVPETLRRLPAIEVKNVAVTKFKFDKNVWDRLSNPHFPVRLYLISRKNPDSDNVVMETQLDFDDGTPTAFPTPIEVWFNNIQIKARFKGLKNKEGTVNPVDLTEHIKSWRAQNVLKIIHVFNKEPYLTYCALVRPYAPEEVLNNILVKPAIPYTLTMETVKKIFHENDGDSDDDAELVTTSTVISLKCPISYSRMKYPIKSKRCDHLQCYDALWFLHSQVQVPNWICPVCQIPLKLDDLYICEFSMRLLNSCANNVENIELLPDCSWNPIYEMEDVSDSGDDNKTDAKLKNESLPVTAKIPKKADPVPLLHNLRDTPVVSLLSDDDEATHDNVNNSNINSSFESHSGPGVQAAKTTKIGNLDRTTSPDTIQKTYNESVQINTANEGSKHMVGKAARTTNNRIKNGDDDDDDDDLPLAQVARKRGLPIDHLLNSTESSLKLKTIGNDQILSRPHLNEGRNLSPSFAPNILGTQPLKNPIETRNLRQLPRDERQLFIGENSNQTRTLDPKAQLHPEPNNLRQHMSPSESRETVLIHKEHLVPIKGVNNKMKIEYLDSNPFVANHNTSSNPNHDSTQINRRQMQNAPVPSIISGTNNPTLPPLPTNIVRQTENGNEKNNILIINPQSTLPKKNVSGIVNNPLGSRPVINPFLPRKTSTTMHKGKNHVTDSGKSEKKDSPWLL
uniref:SUMO/Smt3 ligase n=1 Tax=Nakaseomyces delphensis TaxID=51657 RepID=A7WPJ5_NAKDE|nr:SUMO/Smt3 ligase [Nakaseomyces delphensis]